MTLTPKPLAGHSGAVRSATILPFRRTHDALKVQDLVRAVRHRQVAEALALGAMAAVEVLVEHAVARGGLDQAGTLGLQLAVAGARDAASELAVAHKEVEVAAGEVDHA